jgi:hypothetical protein
MVRIPIATNLESRDGSTAKDAQSKNCTIEVIDPRAGSKKLRKRPGCSDYGLVKTGVAQLLYYWNGIKSIIGDFFCSNTVVTPTSYSAATWNPSDKDAGIALSGGNLIATSASSNSGMVRSTVSVSSGTWVFEITINDSGGDRSFCGMANSSATITNFVGSDNNGIGYHGAGFIYKNFVQITPAPSFTTGDVIGIVYNQSLSTIAFYKNGVFVYEASGSNVPSGALFAAWGAQNLFANIAGTANFGATAYAFSYSTLIASNLSPTTASLPFSAMDNGANAGTDYLMFKNATQAWTLVPSGTPTLITDVDYPGISTVNVTQITRSGSVVTVQTPTDTNFQVGSAVTIAGATQPEYNGVQTITGVTASNVRPAVAIPITITRNGTTATATSTTQPHGFSNGQVVPIQGADQAEYTPGPCKAVCRKKNPRHR